MGTLPPRIGNFAIVRQLGVGGMGTVYLGRDPELGRPVAIKVLRDQVHDQELLGRFLREAQSAAALRHPNIITIYAVGQHDLQPFIAMELVDGDSLADVVRERRPLTLSEKLSLIEQICAGLHFAHRAGIVHRDVKPANLMVDGDGVIRVLDFGIARVEGSGMTREGSMIGTLNYMSPEQMLGRPVDHRSDMFSVGAVAYELLCYKQAFPGALNDGLLQRLPHEDPPPLMPLCPGLSDQIEQVVMRALRKAPDARFADLAEMRLALAAARLQLDEASSLETIVVRPGTPRPSIPGRPPTRPGTSPTNRDALGLLNVPRETRELTIRHHLADAQSHLDQGNSTEARRALQYVMSLDPGNRTATDLLARVPPAAGDGAVPPTTPGSVTERAFSARTIAVMAAGVLVLIALGAVAVSMRPVADDAASALATPPLPEPETTAPQHPPSSSVPERSAEPSRTGSSLAVGPAAVPPARAIVQPPAPSAAIATPSPSQPAVAITPPSVDVAVEDLLARVRGMYAAGDFGGALEALEENPAGSADQRVNEVAGRVARAAYDSMRSAEKNAASRPAADLDAESMRDATLAKGRADAAQERQAWVETGQQALLARDAFQKAVGEGLARRAQAAANAPPPAAAPAPAPNVLDRERAGVAGAMGRFQAAYRSRDIAALIQVFPTLQGAARQQVEQAFRNCGAYDLLFDDMAIDLNAADPTLAQVKVRSTYVCTPRAQRGNNKLALTPFAAPQRDVFSLRKRGDVWVVERTGTE